MNILFKIAIPSMIFSAFDFFPKQIISGDGFSFQQFIFDTIIRGTNWFTCALTVSEIIVFFLLLTRVKNIYFYALCGLLLGILGGHLINIGFSILGNEYLPWFYKSGITACSFITLGGLFFKFQDTINKWGRINLILFIIIILNISLQGQRWSTLGGIDFIGFVISIISILAIIYLCQGFPKVKFVQYISRHTIGFYFLSGSVPYVCIKVINLIIPIGPFSFFVQLISSFFIAWLIVFLLEKYLPFVFDLRIISKKKLS